MTNSISRDHEQKAVHSGRVDTDALDLQILSCLMDNARESARAMSMRLKVSPATVVSRLKGLEKSGAIRGYSALLDYPRLGYDYIAFTEVNAIKGHIMDAMKEISKLSGVVSIYEVTGDFDCLVLTRSRTRFEFSKLIHKVSTLEYVSHTHTHVVFNIVEEENRSYFGQSDGILGSKRRE